MKKRKSKQRRFSIQVDSTRPMRNCENKKHMENSDGRTRQLDVWNDVLPLTVGECVCAEIMPNLLVVALVFVKL